MPYENYSLQIEHCVHYVSNTWRYNNQFYPHHQLYFVRQGDGYVQTPECTVRIEGGRCYLIPAMTPFICWSDSLIDKVYVEFHLGTGPEQLHYQTNHIQSISYSADEYRRLLSADLNTPNGRLWLHGEMYRVMSFFTTSVISEKEEGLLKAAQYINNNLSASLRIYDIAEEIGWNPATFSKQFKKAYNRSLKAYINKQLANQLCRDLLVSDATLAELAEKYQFCDAYYLSAFFKRIMKISPDSYRKNRKTRSDIIPPSYKTAAAVTKPDAEDISPLDTWEVNSVKQITRQNTVPKKWNYDANGFFERIEIL